MRAVRGLGVELREIVWTDGRLFEIGRPAPRADAEGD